MNDEYSIYEEWHFKLNEENQLVTMEGYLVLDEINDFDDYQNLNKLEILCLQVILPQLK